MSLRVTETCTFDLVPKHDQPVEEPEENFRLRVDEVKRYLALDIARVSGGKPLSSVRHQVQTAVTALQAVAAAENNFITIKSFDNFTRHMNRSHSSRLSNKLLWEVQEHVLPLEKRRIAGGWRRIGGYSSLPGDDEPLQPIRITVPLSFQIPLNAHYGLFNIEFLRMIAPVSFNAQLLLPYIPQCLEIHGVSAAQGVYLPSIHLNELLDLME